MGVNRVPASHQLAELMQELFGLVDSLWITFNTQPTLTGEQVDMQPFADEPEMRIINAEKLWKLTGILKLDLFAQYLGQASLHTSIESGPRCQCSPGIPEPGDG